MNLYAASTVNDLRRRYGFQVSKSLGQNFLTDAGIVEQILAGALIGPEDLVIEIGPGMGVITRALAQRARKVIAIEVDKHLLPILAETLADVQQVEIVHGDILQTDVQTLIDRAKQEDKMIGGVRIVGNLPYYITTPIVMKLLKEEVTADSITVMMQKEVADRISSQPGKKTYGAISVAVQYFCTVQHIVNVPRSAFVPQPNVDSAVLRLDRRKEKAVELSDRAVFFSCVKAAFGQRRKTLFNALSNVDGLSREGARLALQRSGIDGQRRGETLNLSEFAALANAVNELL